MPRMICTNCEIELKPEKNGVIVANLFMRNTKIYSLRSADLWKCRNCGVEIVAGFAIGPFAIHFADDCEKIVEERKKKGKTIIYNKEVVG